ncbi:MAG: HesB/IscA family protein [Arenicellales bacterium WSBS_2016_MAG_OTU3]
MAITLTAAAADRVKTYLAEKQGVEGLRLSVKTTGCSGFAYVVDYAKAVEQDDQVFGSHGVKVIVDLKSLELIDGTEIDFTQDELSAAFKFKNPNVTAECGCGESFTVN